MESSGSNRTKLRAWIQKLGTEGHLAFSGKDELKMLMDLYDGSAAHPIQYYFDSRFKGRLPTPDLKLCSTATSNIDRNRTSENYPTDEGLLHTSDGRFINASAIEGKDTTYIATQHPLPSTVLDFWKMVLAEKPAVVVMLNKDDYDKSYQNPNEPELVQYWPGTSKSGPFIDSILLEDKDSGGTVKISVLPEPPAFDIEELDAKTTLHTDSRVQATTPPQASEIISTSIQTKPTSDMQIIPVTSLENTTASSQPHEQTLPNKKSIAKGVNGHQEYKLNPNIEYSRLHVEYEGQSHQLWHIRCGGWKDQEAPQTDLFMDLWTLVQEKLRAHKLNGGEKYKIVIHCTGGVGRTGTFIAVDLAGQELKEQQKSGDWGEFSIEKVIHFLRQKRMNMVGSVSQYIFCHRAALNLFAANHKQISDEQP